LKGETMEPNASQTPEGETPEAPQNAADPTEVHQDSFRKVYLGQVSDPIYPVHPGQPESSDEELLRAAMEDPGTDSARETRPTPWRVVILIALAIVALGLVFLWRL
jgi:hypothetical protein